VSDSSFALLPLLIHGTKCSSFESILLALVHLSLEGEAWQAFTPTLAYTIRLAQNMGYATLGAEVEDSIPNDGVQEREVIFVNVTQYSVLT
jgi:hypothetical protein